MRNIVQRGMFRQVIVLRLRIPQMRAGTEFPFESRGETCPGVAGAALRDVLPDAMSARREKRIPVEILSRYRSGSGRAHIVQVYDLSISGCRMHQNFSALDVGKILTIRLGDVGPIESVVRWKEGLNVGIEFLVPLHPSVFDHIISRHGRGEGA